MAMIQPNMPVVTARCTACGTSGPPTVYACPDDGRTPIALCPACARDPAQLRALIRALRLGTASLGQGSVTSGP